MTKYTTMAKNKCAVIRASIDWGKSAQAAQSDFKHQVVFRQNECHLILGHLTHAMYICVSFIHCNTHAMYETKMVTQHIVLVKMEFIITRKQALTFTNTCTPMIAQSTVTTSIHRSQIVVT